MGSPLQVSTGVEEVLRTDLEVHRLPGRAEALDLNPPMLGKIADSFGASGRLAAGPRRPCKSGSGD